MGFLKLIVQVFFVCFELTWVGESGGSKGGGSKGGRSKGGGSKGGGSRVGILVVFEAPGAQMCTFGVLGLSCEAPAAPKPPGFHTTARPKFDEKTPRGENRLELWAGEARNFGGSGGGPGIQRRGKTEEQQQTQGHWCEEKKKKKAGKNEEKRT